MADPNKINNPPIPPIQPTEPPSRENPTLGAGEEAQPRPFSLPPTSPDKAASAQAPTEAGKPSPMEMARDMERDRKPQWSEEEMQNNLEKLQSQLSEAQENLSDSGITKNFTDDHYTALTRLIDKMTPDMRTIAKNTNTDFPPIKKTQGEGVIGYVSRWINGSQDTLSSALSYLGQDQKPDPASFLKLQFAVQRAVQRGELFASIVGAGVSGIKTIMSTQLG